MQILAKDVVEDVDWSGNMEYTCVDSALEKWQVIWVLKSIIKGGVG